tara:strand:- start:4370 stop:4858 length:489 start_codon:yes stop_codon:yes gene_type:complete
MKKISYLLFSIIFITNIYSCSGYKPIFSSSNLNFEITNYSIKGDKRIGRQIYSKLKYLSQANDNTPGTKKIYIEINTLKNKVATAKNSAGKILGYRIDLSTEILVKNDKTNEQIFSENFSHSSSYKVQDQHSETINLENNSIENLIDITYQDLVLKLSENII